MASRLTDEAIGAKLESLWGSQPVPTIVPDGVECRLQHPQTGDYVLFGLTRGDLMLSVEDFASNVLEPAVAALQRKMAG